MTNDGKARIFFAHPLAVIAHPHALDPAFNQLDRHLIGARILRVVEQLLHDRRGPLDHLACCDSVDQAFIEELDLRHTLLCQGELSAASIHPSPLGPLPRATSSVVRGTENAGMQIRRPATLAK